MVLAGPGGFENLGKDLICCSISDGRVGIEKRFGKVIDLAGVDCIWSAVHSCKSCVKDAHDISEGKTFVDKV